MSAGEEERYPGPDVIIWTPTGRDASLARDVLAKAGIGSQCCQSIDEVCVSLSNENVGPAIFAEEALDRATIERLRMNLEAQASWSDIPLILLTGGGNSTGASLSKLRRMRALGNLTLLERPLRSVTLVAAVQAGLASRKRQLQTRDYIQDLQEAQDRLAQANADLKQFAFAASHDLQEPLRNVNVFTQILLERHVDSTNEQAREFAGYVRTGVLRMGTLLRDLLLYSRAIHEEQASSTVKFDLQKAIDEAVETLRIEISESEARIETTAIPEVRGNETQLSLVLQNLLSNSIKYARPGIPPLVKISGERRGEEALIRVKDNGIGFEQKYSERVFELFQRLSKNEIPGTGLGLAICRRIIERHGGRIWVNSELGAGTEVMFTLPAD